MTLFKRSTTRQQKITVSKKMCRCECGNMEVVPDGQEDLPMMICPKCGLEMTIVASAEKPKKISDRK